MRRSEIQTLRAVAVFFVLAYHSGLPMKSGYLGVDIFFVISGFVITSKLTLEFAQNKKINLINFFWKRYLRLAPNLSVVVIFTLFCSLIILNPLGQIQNAAITGAASLFSLANIVIAYFSGNYFSAPAYSNPLLHTWSLSLEEQFYIFLPIILLFVLFITKSSYKLTKIFMTSIFSIISLFSLFSIVYFSKYDPSTLKSQIAGYYSPLSRSWEFGFGVVLAFIGSRNVSERIWKYLFTFGLILLFGSALLPSQQHDLNILVALIPVLVTTCLLFFRTTEGSGITGFYKSKFFTYFGDRSYSIYLWHWPFVVFAKVLFPDNQFFLLIAVITSLIPAVIVYDKIEHPVRIKELTNSVFLKTRILIVFTLVPLVICLSLGTLAQNYLRPISQKSSGFFKGDLGDSRFYEYIHKKFALCEPLLIRDNAPKFIDNSVRCQQSKNVRTPPSIVFIGDSHAEDLFPGLANNFPNKNIGYYIQPNLPVSENELQSKIINYLVKTNSIKDVILSASWGSRGFPIEGIANTISSLTKSGKRVFISDGRPYFSDPSICKFGIAGIGTSMYCTKSLSFENEIRNNYYYQILELKRKFPNLIVLPTFNAFCKNEECSMIYGDRILYRDFTHLNSAGSDFVWEIMLRDKSLQKLFN